MYLNVNISKSNIITICKKPSITFCFRVHRGPTVATHKCGPFMAAPAIPAFWRSIHRHSPAATQANSFGTRFRVRIRNRNRNPMYHEHERSESAERESFWEQSSSQKLSHWRCPPIDRMGFHRQSNRIVLATGIPFIKNESFCNLILKTGLIFNV